MTDPAALDLVLAAVADDIERRNPADPHLATWAAQHAASATLRAAATLWHDKAEQLTGEVRVRYSHAAAYAGQLAADLEAHDQPATALSGGAVHRYLSTSCLHGRHDHCQSGTNIHGGTKRPGVCKWCPARCVCRCHQKQGELAPAVGAATEPAPVLAPVDVGLGLKTAVDAAEIASLGLYGRRAVAAAARAAIRAAADHLDRHARNSADGDADAGYTSAVEHAATLLRALADEEAGRG